MRTRPLIVVAMLGALVRTTGAEPPVSEADKLFAAGREMLMVKQDSLAACELFERSIKLDPRATGTMLNLGLCYENLGKYATSLYWFRKAQAAAAENQLEEYEAAAKQHTIGIAPKVPTLTIRLVPAEAQLLIDGRRIPNTELGHLELDPGTHQLVARHPGKRQVTQTLEISAGDRDRQLPIELTEDAVPVYVDRGAGRRRGAVYLGIGGLGLLGAVGAYGFVEKHRYEDRNDDNARVRLRWFGTSMFVVGAGAVTTAIWLYMTAPGKELVSDGTMVAPVVTDQALGLAITGSY